MKISECTFCHQLLVFLSLHILSFQAICSNFFIILLKSSHVLPRLRELTFLHSLSNIPMYEGSLCVHEVELVVESGPSLSYGGGVGQHAHGSLDHCQVTSRDHSGGLIINTNFEPS